MLLGSGLAARSAIAQGLDTAGAGAKGGGEAPILVLDGRIDQHHARDVAWAAGV